jgi:hypothetical protein
MKKVFVIFLVFAALGATAVWLWYTNSTTTRQLAYEQEVAQLRERYARALPAVASQDENYASEIQSWLSVYFRELAGIRGRREYKDYPKFFAQDGFIQDLEYDKSKAFVSDSKYEMFKEGYDFAKGVFDRMQMGDYEPELTMRHNSFRLDLFNIRKAKIGGNETLLADFALWNYPGELNFGAWHSIVCLGPNTLTEGQKALEEFELWKTEALEIVVSHIDEAAEFAKGEARVRRERYVPATTIQIDAFGGELKLPLDEAAFFSDLCIKGGRRIVDADDTEPYSLIDPSKPQRKGKRMVPDFPPGVVIGTYQLPLVPAHTKYMTMEMSFGVRTTQGTAVEFPLTVNQWQLDESWKMEPGRDWTDMKIAD